MQITGLGTGLDIDGLVEGLMTNAAVKLTNMKARQTAYANRLSVWSNIKTKLSGFQSAIETLQSKSVFQSKTAKSSNEDVAAVSITGGASAGKYALHVISVATATKVGSVARMGNTVDSDAALKDSGLAVSVNAGSISVNGTSIDIDPATDTLNTVLDRINAAVPDVRAAFDSDTGKVTFTYIGGEPDGTVQLGSGADTGNFFQAIGVDGKTGTEITSTTTLGSVSTTKALGEANFKNSLDASGEFEINGVKIAYDASRDGLADIIDRINNSDAQVTATYDATEDKLVLTALYTGSKTIQMTDVSGNFLETVGLNSATQSLGDNAEYYIDEINGGSILTSSSNDISGVISGVSFTLTDKGDTTITVANDTEAAISAIKDFVTQYNNAINAIATATAKDGILQGDSTANRLKNNLRQYTMNLVSSVSGNLNLASEIGISIDKNGTMTLDEGVLKEAMTENSGAVYELFNSTDGIATRLSNELTIWLKDSTGIIPSREASLNKLMDNLDTDIENETERLERKQERLYAKFNAMDTAVSALESQLNYVLNMIEAMNSDDD
ncbi:MAG: flagellar filament capping protein FliD [Dehalobacterium sp.]